MAKRKRMVFKKRIVFPVLYTILGNIQFFDVIDSLDVTNPHGEEFCLVNMNTLRDINKPSDYDLLCLVGHINCYKENLSIKHQHTYYNTTLYYWRDCFWVKGSDSRFSSSDYYKHKQYALHRVEELKDNQDIYKMLV